MVIYFRCEVVDPSYLLYMGEDKHENEDLIKNCWPEDVWFHVDKVSSAHVYLRLRQGQNIDDIPEEILIDCAQLVKANSIKGDKMNNVDIVYTMATNLKKTGEMDVGQVGFVKDKEVRKMHVASRDNDIIRRLNKTREERKPDLIVEREERDRQERLKQRKVTQEQKEREKEEDKRRREEAERRSYTNLMKAENMKSNLDQDDDDDFM